MDSLQAVQKSWQIANGDYIDVPSFGAGDDGAGLVWDNDAGAFGKVELTEYADFTAHTLAADPHTGYLLADGSRDANPRMAVVGQPAGESTPVLTATRTFSGTAASPVMTALFRNTGDEAGGSDYQNEVHLRLQAGTASDHRRYLNFAGYDGVDDWLTGANASNTWILYDANSNAHRVWANTSAGGGNTYLNSVGSGAVIINALNDGGAGMGTGGLKIGAGGASGQFVFAIDATGSFASGISAPLGRYQGYIYRTVTETSGASVGGLFIQPTIAPASTSTVSAIGIYANPVSGGAAAQNAISGMVTVATHGASNTLASLIGGQFVAENTVGQTVSAAFGGQFSIRNTHASGLIPTAYALYVSSPTNSGAITVYYGLRILDATATNLTVGIRSDISAASNKYNLYINGTAQNAISGNLYLGGIAAATAVLDINSDVYRVRTSKTPTSAGAAGNAGDHAWDSNYLYVCVATNTWKRAALSTW